MEQSFSHSMVELFDGTDLIERFDGRGYNGASDLLITDLMEAYNKINNGHILLYLDGSIYRFDAPTLSTIAIASILLITSDKNVVDLIVEEFII